MLATYATRGGGGRNTGDVIWVDSCEADDTNDTEKADTIKLVSVTYIGGHEVSIETYNPAVRKIPVKIIFCRTEVRRRHKRGTGLILG